MSRYTITVSRTESRHADPDATFGYDRPLQTFFLRAFPDAEGEDLQLWLGTDIREFETLAQLRAAPVARGFDFIPLASGILHRLLDDHAREARQPVSDLIIQYIQRRIRPLTHAPNENSPARAPGYFFLTGRITCSERP